MPSKQSQQLLDTIDAVLAECSKERRPAAAPRPSASRPAWRPMWAEDGQSAGRSARDDEGTASAP